MQRTRIRKVEWDIFAKRRDRWRGQWKIQFYVRTRDEVCERCRKLGIPFIAWDQTCVPLTLLRRSKRATPASVWREARAQLHKEIPKQCREHVEAAIVSVDRHWEAYGVWLANARYKAGWYQFHANWADGVWRRLPD